MATAARPCLQASHVVDVGFRVGSVARRRRRRLEILKSILHLPQIGPRFAAVDRVLAARRAVCRASRLPCSRRTCTDAGTDAAQPCRTRRRRTGRSDCPTSA